ncbi:MAG: transcription termination factor Rho [Alphaproteobacteria bacterium]|nr:transcription termination factor Rho [Alphaproteobacteria bacterium]
MPLPDLLELRALDTASLVRRAQDSGVAYPGAMSRQQLVFEILCAEAGPGDRVAGSGVLEVLPDGFGFLRDPGANFLPGPDDVYVSPSQIRRFNLRTGDEIAGRIRAPKDNERYFALIKVEQLNGEPPEDDAVLRSFDLLTPRAPSARLILEHAPGELSTRMLDLFCPLGKGQRGLIIAPPRAGHVELLRAVAEGLHHNHPELHLCALLVDARPEDAAELRRALPIELVSTTFEEPPARQVQVAELLLARCQRLVERGRDVVLLVDSITKLARAAHRAAGHPISGTLDAEAMLKPKRLMAAARDTEEAGSLTVLASALTETGATVDSLILQELSGVANLEIVLDAEAAAERWLPALDLSHSRTSGEVSLREPKELERVGTLRQALQGRAAEDLEWVAERLGEHPRNSELLAGIP